MKSYETMWKQIIEPSRLDYSLSSLGDQVLIIDGVEVVREDFEVMSSEGVTLKCSLFRPMVILPNERRNLVVYCHARGGARIEGLFLVRVFLPRVLVLLFDFAGSGLSGG